MYLFNPDNDLALANFGAHYTPPSSALRLAEDLALLPVWYAPEKAKIVATGEENSAFLASVQKRFGIRNSLIPFSDIARFPDEKIVPWGWNPSLRKKLLNAGVPEKNMPSIEQLMLLRDYSGRQHAVRMLSELKPKNTLFCGESHHFTQPEDVLRYLSAAKSDSALKMPNSGSGKGLVWIKGVITDKQTDWCRRVIKEQGGVVAEPALHKVQDFALEFLSEKGVVRFAGYSLFQSTASGAYSGNTLLSDADIEKTLSAYVSNETLHFLKTFYEQKLGQYFPQYNGYIGVDMMVCSTREGFRIQPCVEMNMRMNMGMAARIFHDRFVVPNTRGRFAVDFFGKQGAALAHHLEMAERFPAVIKNGRIETGYFPLTPVSEQTHYVAYALTKAARQ